MCRSTLKIKMQIYWSFPKSLKKHWPEIQDSSIETHPISKLKMQVAWLGVKPEVNTLSIVPDNVFSTRIMIVAPPHKLLHATRKGSKKIIDLKV